jgi:hypothetical protein
LFITNNGNSPIRYLFLCRRIKILRDHRFLIYQSIEKITILKYKIDLLTSSCLNNYVQFTKHIPLHNLLDGIINHSYVFHFSILFVKSKIRQLSTKTSTTRLLICVLGGSTHPIPFDFIILHFGLAVLIFFCQQRLFQILEISDS